MTTWAVAHQAPLSVAFPRQEYWSGLPFPSPGDLPDPGIEPRSPTLQVDSLLSEPPGKPNIKINYCNAGDPGSIPGSGRSLGEENGNPLQYSYLENPKNRGAWLATALEVARILKLVHVPINYSCVKNHART